MVKNPALAVHVHNIGQRVFSATRPTLTPYAVDIRIAPLTTGTSTIQPKFMVSLLEAFKLCTNLRSFTCTLNVLPALLIPLKDHESLEALRVNATLEPPQTQLLIAYSKLKSLALDACSWNVVDACCTHCKAFLRSG